jgi:hypothetical protein
MTDLEVFASDCQELLAKIEAANVLWKIWHDIEGDQ